MTNNEKDANHEGIQSGASVGKVQGEVQCLIDASHMTCSLSKSPSVFTLKPLHCARVAQWGPLTSRYLVKQPRKWQYLNYFGAWMGKQHRKSGYLVIGNLRLRCWLVLNITLTTLLPFPHIHQKTSHPISIFHSLPKKGTHSKKAVHVASTAMGRYHCVALVLVHQVSWW